MVSVSKENKSSSEVNEIHQKDGMHHFILPATLLQYLKIFTQTEIYLLEGAGFGNTQTQLGENYTELYFSSTDCRTFNCNTMHFSAITVLTQYI